MPKFAKITLGASASLVGLIVAVSACSAGTAAPVAAAPSAVPSVPGVAVTAPASSVVPVAAPATSAPAPAPAPAAPQVFEGKGDDVVTLDKGDGPAVLDFECPRCSGNVIVTTDGRENLLVNTIGSYKGRHLIDYYDGSMTSTLEIKATGSWKMTVTEGLGALRNSNGAAIPGAGDDVVVVTHPTATKAHIENRKGDSNFVVWVISSSSGYGPDLAVNTIGGYAGTVLMSPPAVVIVTSDGEWSIAPQ